MNLEILQFSINISHLKMVNLLFFYGRLVRSYSIFYHFLSTNVKIVYLLIYNMLYIHICVLYSHVNQQVFDLRELKPCSHELYQIPANEW